jgi:hypothetical protein
MVEVEVVRGGGWANIFVWNRREARRGEARKTEVERQGNNKMG